MGRRGGQQGIVPAQMGLMLAPLSCSPAVFRLPDDWTYSSMMVWIARSVALVALVKRAFSCKSAWGKVRCGQTSISPLETRLPRGGTIVYAGCPLGSARSVDGAVPTTARVGKVEVYLCLCLLLARADPWAKRERPGGERGQGQGG